LPPRADYFRAGKLGSLAIFAAIRRAIAREQLCR
jgi:hypothetical protein